MKYLLHLAVLAGFLATSGARAQLPIQHSAKQKKPTACRFRMVAEYREATTKAGLGNVICLMTDFDAHNDECWWYLAEYYYNVVPVQGVKIQRIYFVQVPKETGPIRTLAALNSSPFKRNTFFECIYNAVTGKYSFVNYPFASS